MTRALLMLWPAIMLGCVSAPEVNPWAERERASVEAEYPIEPPELAEDLSNLGSVLETGLGNYDIAEANAEALESLSLAYNATLDAAEQDHAFLARQLREERRGRLWDKMSYWAVIAAGVLLGISR